MKRIALLITGGTIGMHTQDGESSIPSEQLGYQELAKLAPQEVSITNHVLCYKDSSSIGVDTWQLITDKISQLAKEYDAFIISHGTDTMAYSAAAVAYHFGKHLPCPIVFTGACRSPDVPDTDAWTNLRDAVQVACSNLGEVVVVFAGSVWRAARVIKIPASDDAIFTTPGLTAVAEVGEEGLTIKPHCYLTDPHSKLKDVPAKFSDKLLFIHSMPALSPSMLQDLAKSPTWQLCLIQGMGAGNVTDELISFIAASLQQHKHLVIMPAQLGPITAIYPPLKEALELGAILAEGYSVCSLWAKLSWLMAKTETESHINYLQQREMLRQELSKDFIGELVLS